MNKFMHIPNPPKTYSSLASCYPSVSQLYIQGEKPELLDDEFDRCRVAIVGTRNATLAGLADARRIAQVVAKNGGIVVSGMALGIDGAAHQGAIDVNGNTIAVLGSGIDVIYPTRHEKLSREIKNHGCIISEFDCETKALAWHFPIRNRIIAALADVIVIPEGTIRGGARITVDLALAMGKTVFGIPGPRRNRASELPNSIIRDGAHCLLDPSDVLHEMGIDSGEVGWQLENTSGKDPTVLENKSVQRVIEEMAHNPLTSLDVAHICNYTEKEAIRLLASIESAGFIRFNRGVYELAQ